MPIAETLATNAVDLAPLRVSNAITAANGLAATTGNSNHHFRATLTRGFISQKV